MWLLIIHFPQRYLIGCGIGLMWFLLKIPRLFQVDGLLFASFGVSPRLLWNCLSLGTVLSLKLLLLILVISDGCAKIEHLPLIKRVLDVIIEFYLSLLNFRFIFFIEFILINRIIFHLNPQVPLRLLYSTFIGKFNYWSSTFAIGREIKLF